MLELGAASAFTDNYIWVLADAEGAAIAVDPGDARPLDAYLQRRNLRLTAILVTHHHADHIGGVADLAARHGAKVWAPFDPRIEIDCTRVGDGDEIEIDAPGASFRAMEVPGHTRSHVVFHGEGLLFCGDTLFSLGCGRLFEGSPAQMLASLDRLAALPGDTRVCCGHEYTRANGAFAATVEPGNAALARRRAEVDRLRDRDEPTLPVTLASEKECNPFLRVDAPAVVDWCRARGAGDSRVERFAALRAAKDEFRA